MSLTLLAAALLSTAAEPAAPPPPEYRVDRSLSDVDRLTELRIDVDSALRRGEIDQAAAARFYLDIERVRRQMIRMGLQFGVRQKVRLRARIDGLYARLAESRARAGAEIRSGN